MSHDFRALVQDINTTLGTLSKDMPDTMKAFAALGQAATADGALDKKTKELLALGIAISARCDGCIGFHTQKLVKYGVTREEFVETIAMAVYMGGGPSMMYAAEAMQAYEQFSQ